MKIFIGSHNKDKIKEIESILTGFEVLSFKEFPDAPDVDEDKDTIEGNACKKAVENARFTGLLTAADDTGLFVRALNDKPGVYSARYAGEGCSYQDNREKMLREMDGVTDRYAEFRTVVALADKNGLIATAHGVIAGEITTQELGELGFGYDSIFKVTETQKTFAQMTDSAKNRISHRALAFLKIKEHIEQYFETSKEK